jgi:lysophospholipase L1-like esterase
MKRRGNQVRAAGAGNLGGRGLRWWCAAGAAVLAACSDDTDSNTEALSGRAVYAAWAASAQSNLEAFPVAGAPPPMPPALSNQTVRQVVHLSAGGEQLRVRLSNLFGTSALSIDKVSVARSSGGAAIDVASQVPVSFGGAARASIPAGQELWSDFATLATTAESDLAVTLYVAGQASVDTGHSVGQQTTYVSAGDQVAAATLPPENPAPAMPRRSYYWLTGVDAAAASAPRVVVTFGDSITDGVGSTPDTNHRYPNYLARRLQSTGNYSVVNQGISGNRVLSDVVGPSARSRFRRDAVQQSGASAVIILIGINDLGFGGFVPEQEATVDALTAGLSELISTANGANLSTFVGTLLPLKGTNAPYYSEITETKRQAVNAWIRANRDIDGVVDFDRSMQDSSDPLIMRPSYDSSDHLHPNDAGYEAMANTVNLSDLD